MNTHTPTFRSGRRIGALLATVAAAASLTLTTASILAPTSSAASAKGCTGSYRWPVAPFSQQHPVRGSFGDPRTIFETPPTTRGLYVSGGRFSFHQGVDISAPNGTSVFPVADGVVTRVTREWIRVDCGNGRAFEYWHIRPAVHTGERVLTGATVLGRVLAPAEHVHLTELRNGRAVNPQAQGHLTPYDDSTEPEIASVELRRADDAPAELPAFVRGSVHFYAEAYDTPSVPVPGIWHGLPVTPALITWRLEVPGGRTLTRTAVARDVRSRVPGNDAFWQVFARGTYQNMAVFGPHYSFLQRGRYVFRLTAQPFDTRQLRDGVYELVVLAADIRGNRASHRLRFTMHNRAGWVGSFDGAPSGLRSDGDDPSN
jgi:murein DD-endopeptidase MepM/ murein hydrolase activator NlpD